MQAVRPETRPWVVYGALVLVQVFFGVHYLAAKIVVREIPPAGWALLRVAAGAGLLLALTRATGRRFPSSPRILLQLGGLSIFGVLINQLCFIEGLALTSATHSSVLVTTIPVGTLLFAVLLRRERFSMRKLLCIVIAFAGVLLVVVPASPPGAGTSIRGDTLILINALSYSLFLVLSKRLMGRIDPLAGTAILLTCGSVWMLVPGLSPLLATDLSAVSPPTWGLAAFIVVFPTALAYLWIYWALARVESSVVAFFIYLQPLIAAGLAAVLLGESPTSTTLVGAGLIFAAVYLALAGSVSRARRARNSAPLGNTDSSMSNRGE